MKPKKPAKDKPIVFPDCFGNKKKQRKPSKCLSIKPDLKLLKKIEKHRSRPNCFGADHSIWEQVLIEDNELRNLYYDKKAKTYPDVDDGSKYLAEEKIFHVLVPVFDMLCYEILRRNLIADSKKIFNSIDFISECLYHLNPKFPERRSNWRSIYYIYQHRDFTKLRPYYPLHYILTKEQAALIIQKWLRGNLVRMNSEVRKMRRFWNDVAEQDWKLHKPKHKEEYLFKERKKILF